MKWLRRHFDTFFTVIQVWVDGITVLLSCLVAFALTKWLAPERSADLKVYSQLVVVISGVTLGCFWLFGMYKWRKSILNVEEYRNAFKAIVSSFLMTTAFIFLLRAAEGEPEDLPWIYQVLKPLHDLASLNDTESYSRLTFVLIFVAIFGLTVLQRGLFFHLASVLHARGYGNTNVAVFGTGPLALRVQQKMRLTPMSEWSGAIGSKPPNVAFSDFTLPPLPSGR